MSAYNQKLCITSAFPWHLSMQHESGAGTEAVFLGSQQVSYSRSQEKQNGNVWSFPSSVGQHKPTNKNNYISYIYTVYASSIPKNSQSNLLIMYLSQDLILLLLWLQQLSLLQTLQRLWYFFLKGMQRLVPNPPAWGKKSHAVKSSNFQKTAGDTRSGADCEKVPQPAGSTCWAQVPGTSPPRGCPYSTCSKACSLLT